MKLGDRSQYRPPAPRTISHVTTLPLPYDWAKRDVELRDDREYVGDDGWLRSTVG